MSTIGFFVFHTSNLEIKSILGNPWVIGIGTAVIAGLILYFFGTNLPIMKQNHTGTGDNVAGNKYTYENKKFSETQVIQISNEPGDYNEELNLDNLAKLKLVDPFDKTQDKHGAVDECN